MTDVAPTSHWWLTMGNGRAVGIGVAILTVSALARRASADDWGTAGLDLAHTRSSGERSGEIFSEGRWTTSVSGWTIATPVVEDGYLVTVTLDGVVSALQADTGEFVWRVSLGSSVQGTPTLARGRVFVPTGSGILYALRLADGATLWTRDLGGMTLSSPTPIDGDIVVAPGLPTLTVVRLSGETGDLVWQTPPMWQFSNTAPAVGGGLVVVGSQQGRYYAFDAATGALRWEYVAEGVVNLAAPIILGGRVYMAGGDQSNRVHAVDASTGKAAPGWPIDLPTPAPDIAGTRQGGWRAVSSFAAVGGVLLLQTRLDDAMGTRPSGPFNYLSRESLVALNPSSGALVWQRALARAQFADVNDVPKFFLCPTPAGYGSKGGAPLAAVASSLDSTVAVFDVASGNELARYAVAGAALASPVFANGRLFATSMHGTTEGLGSSNNHAPAAPVATTYSDPIDLANLTLSWSPAVDLDGDAASYELRIDADGEVLHSTVHTVSVEVGTTSARITAALSPGVIYGYAVRARDPYGARSPWSDLGTFTVKAGAGSTDPVATPGGMSPPAGMTMPTMMGAVMPGSTGNSGEGPRIATTPTPEPGSTDPMAGSGCSIGGQTRGGGLTASLIVLGVALRARRRKEPR
jgi:outer membrane protein assembly factor BamB